MNYLSTLTLTKISTQRPANHHSRSTTYNSAIDGLRAIAVISVILNHFGSDLLPSGFLGVDIFFVISGYVITGSLCNTGSDSLVGLLLEFYSRRVKRIIPALLLCVVSTSALICLFNPAPTITLKTGIAALFGLSNIYLFKQETDYFGASAHLNVFTQTWSLGVEEQFYLLFPFILWVSGVGRSRITNAKLPFFLIGTVSIISIILFIVLSLKNQAAAYFLMPSRLWELAAGAMLFFLTLNYETRTFSVVDRINPLLIIVALTSLLLTPAKSSLYTTPAVVALTMWLIASSRHNIILYKALSHPLAIHIGRISYSLYLWHWSVLAISRWTIGIHCWTIPLQVGLMWVLSEGSHRYIERPLRVANWSSFRWKTITYGFLALSCSALLLMALVKPLGSRLYTGKHANMLAIGTSTLTDVYVIPNSVFAWHGEQCVLSDNKQVGKIIPIDACTLGNFSTAKHRVLVVGNSFSAAFVHAFDQLVIADNYAVTITSSWGASPVPDVPNRGPWDKANDYYWKSVVPSLASHLRPGDWVFLMSDMSDFSPIKVSSDSKFNLKLLETGLTTISEKLDRDRIRLAVLDGIPFARDADCEPDVAVKQWFSPLGGPCTFYSKKDTLKRRKNLDTIIYSLHNAGKISAIDLMDIFCPGDTCTYNAKNGQFLYRDVWSHPSVEAAQLSASRIRNALTTSDSITRPHLMSQASAF